jgi:uncharacterized protein (TIGR03435 family)
MRVHMATVFPGVVLLLAAGLGSAQPADPRPAYEAATIKPNLSGSGSSSTNGTKGQIVFTNVTLRRLIERAYDVKPIQVIGPNWLESIRFDITAKYPNGYKPEDRAPMLRRLLEERFKLAVHREPKDVPGYALVVARSGFKLSPASGSDSSTNSNGDAKVETVTAKANSMAQFADLLARHLGAIVVDRTGVKGVYDFEVRWANEETNAASEPDAPPSVFTAIQEKLGVRLQAQKVPVAMVVVDTIERVPTEN